MKALSVRQPWAWLIVNGHKNIENRTWRTWHCGPLLIHASKAKSVAEYEAARLVADRLGISLPAMRDLQYGGIVGQVQLVDCGQFPISPWFTGPFGWHLRDARLLPFRPLAGRLGLFEVDGGSLNQ